MLFSVVYCWGRREGEELHQNQDLFYLLARRFYILPDVLLFFYLSIITAYQTYSLTARYLFVCVANMFTLMIKLELKAS